MAFFSWQFICFLIVAVTVYYLIPGRFQWIVLLISSACIILWAVARELPFLWRSL